MHPYFRYADSRLVPSVAGRLRAVGYAGSQALAPDLDPVAGDVAAGGVPAPGAPPTATGAPSQVRPVVAGPTPHGRVVPGVAFEVLLVPGPTLLGPGEEVVGLVVAGTGPGGGQPALEVACLLVAQVRHGVGLVDVVLGAALGGRVG